MGMQIDKVFFPFGWPDIGIQVIMIGPLIYLEGTK